MAPNSRKLVHPINFKSPILKYFVLGFLALSALGYFVWKNVPEAVMDQPVIKNSINKFDFSSFDPVPFKKAGTSALLPSAKWVPQTFNNCGPAATSMVLQHFGFNVNQEETKARLRTNPQDTNVFIYEISDYLKKDFDIESKIFINGDLPTIKNLVANGIYVVVEDFLNPNEDIGHVLIIRGFDDNAGVLIADDSYFGVGIKYPYKTWEETQWKPYGREFMPVYLSDKEDLVHSIIGENWNETTMHRNAVSFTQSEIKDNPNDMYALFNLGASYYALGEYQKAKEAFEKSQSLGWPNRMLWYQIQPIQTYNKLGEYQKALKTADLALWFNDNFAEVHYEKALSYKGLGDTQKVKEEALKALQADPNFIKARDLSI